MSEEELHFVTMCPLYEDIRDELFTHYINNFDLFYELSNEDKFNLIMTHGDVKTIKLIFKMYTRRLLFM